MLRLPQTRMYHNLKDDVKEENIVFLLLSHLVNIFHFF